MSEIIEYPSGTATVLGSGYDLIERTPKFTPLEPVSLTTEGRGPDITTLSFVESSYELNEFLQAGMEGAYDSLVFSGSAKADFVNDTKINRYSLLFVVHCKAVKNTEIAVRPKLHQDALDLIGDGHLIDFRDAYGDHFVSALTRGGELFGMIKIQTSSESEYSDLRLKLSASGVGWSSSASLQRLISQHVASNKITVKVRVSGISDYITPTTAAELFTLAKHFPNKVMAYGTPLKIALKPVSNFPQYSAAVAQFSPEVRYALWRLSDHYVDYKMLLNNITFMLSSAGRRRFDFDSVSKAHIAVEKDKVLKKLSDLEAYADKLVQGTMQPGDPKVVNFQSAFAFEETLKLPNSIEVIQIPEKKVYPLYGHVRGDEEMKGHRPKINVRAVINNDKRVPACVVSVKMEEDRKDWTTFKDSAAFKVGDLRQSGFEYASIIPKAGKIYAQAGKDDHKWHWYDSRDDGLLKKAHCRSDVKGKETGKIGADKIHFNPIKMSIAPIKRPAPAAVGPRLFKSRSLETVRYWMHRDPDSGSRRRLTDGVLRPMYSTRGRVGLPVDMRVRTG